MCSLLIQQWGCGVDYDRTVFTQLCEILKIYVEKCGSNINSLQSATYSHSEEKDWDFCNCKRSLRSPLAEEFSAFTLPMADGLLSNPRTFYMNFVFVFLNIN